MINKKKRQGKLISPTKEKSYTYLAARNFDNFTPFMQISSRRIWDCVQVLTVGAILAPGKRTVSSVLHVMGLKDEKQLQNYHRVLNRARWSALEVSKVLSLLIEAFILADQSVFLGGDETMERRWGPKIRAKSIFRDNRRSSKEYYHFTRAYAKKGQRLPSLNQVLTDPKTKWTQITLPWYSGQCKEVELCLRTALWATQGERHFLCVGSWFATPWGRCSPRRFCPRACPCLQLRSGNGTSIVAV